MRLLYVLISIMTAAASSAVFAERQLYVGVVDHVVERNESMRYEQLNKLAVFDPAAAENDLALSVQADVGAKIASDYEHGKSFSRTVNYRRFYQSPLKITRQVSQSRFLGHNVYLASLKLRVEATTITF